MESIGVVEKTKQTLHIVKLQEEWIRLAKVYIAILEMEIKNRRKEDVR